MRIPAKDMYRSCAIAALAAAALCGPLFAQVPEVPTRHLIRVGFGGGVVVPMSDAVDVFENGFTGQAFVLVDPGLGFPLRFNLGYQKFDYKEPLENAASGQTSILGGTAGIEMNLLRIGAVRSYINAGLGAFRLESQFDDEAIGTGDAQLRFGIDGGGGLSLKLGRLEAFIEGRVQNVYTDEGAIDRKDIRSIPVTFGILF